MTPKEIIKETNKLRKAQGLSPLVENKNLSLAAKARVNDMVHTGSFSHQIATTTPGITYNTFIDDTGYKRGYSGENLARGYAKAKDVLKGFTDSPTHKANLLNKNYSDVGIAITKGKQNGKTVNYIVQMFGSPKK